MSETTHFGFQTVPATEKAQKVRAVFDSVASNYDVMNDAMSMGLHRLWKRSAVALAKVRPGEQVLDLAGGTGDLTALLAKAVGPSGLVMHTDINEAMLREGRNRLLNDGLIPNSQVCNAEALPYRKQQFDLVTIAFGLRNVTDKPKALKEMARVLKPGGRLMVLEFSEPHAALKKPYDWYSFNILPKLGQLLAKDSASYQYLAESIRMHPNQSNLAVMIEAAGFGTVSYFNFAAGIVAVHIAHIY
jgi:demethylmenaquinone methyltransferase / 2-methoxy-6-polyprenyl-1,4-benzoquinol methylase